MGDKLETLMEYLTLNILFVQIMMAPYIYIYMHMNLAESLDRL